MNSELLYMKVNIMFDNRFNGITKITVAVAFMAFLLAIGSYGIVSADQVAAESSTKTTWEYMSLAVDGFLEGPFGAVGVYSDLPSTEIGQGVYTLENGVPTFIDEMNRLGAEGWELVDFTYNVGDRGAVLLFKRPL